MNISIRTKLQIGITIFSLFVSSIVAFFVFHNSQDFIVQNETTNKSFQLENEKKNN